jgi:hypothetical protein
MALELPDSFAAANAAGPVPNGSASLVDELPIFTIERAQLAFSVAANFAAAEVANNVIILALSNGRILRIDLTRPEDIDGASDSHDLLAQWLRGN